MPEETPSEPPASKAFKWVTQILSARGFILGVAAILTAAASWFKAPDTTATKATYEVIVSKVNEVAKATESNHDDIAALRAYLDGYTKAELIKPPPPPSTSPGPQLPLVQTPGVVDLKKKKNSTPDYFAKALKAEAAKANALEDYKVGSGSYQDAPDPKAMADVAQVHELPSISPRPAAAELPSFDQVVQESSKKKN